MQETVIITGASSGIGEATAYKFASEGYDLVLIARSLARLEKVKNQALKNAPQIKVEILNVDLNHFDANSLKFPSTPTILVNNAGIFNQNKPDDNQFKIWEDMFSTNLLGSVKVTQALWSIFKKNKKGSIVNVSSTLGLKPSPGTSAYSASKAAMVNWTLCLAQEGGEFNIRANCVCPGFVDTPIHSFHTLVPAEKDKIFENIFEMQLLRKVGKPEHIAESIFFFGSELSSFTTGAIHSIDGGINIK